MTSTADDLASLNGERMLVTRKLADALRIFASKADHWDDESGCLEIELNAYGRGVQPCMALQNFRDARAALKEYDALRAKAGG